MSQSTKNNFLDFLTLIGFGYLFVWILQMLGKEKTVYSCPNCNNDIEFNATTCPNCHVQLKWPATT